MIHVDLTTEEKKKELYELFDSFKSKREIFEYFGVCDNTQNTNILKEIGKEIDFDFEVYKERRRIPKTFCKNCGKEITSENYFRQKFCSSSCAASYNNKQRGERSEETKKKISEKLVKYYEDRITKEHSVKQCKFCGKAFTTKKKKQKFCSTKCANLYYSLICDSEKLGVYRRQCSFKFSIREYGEEFNIELLKECGMYKPSNRGNNLKGVSRDHMFSVKKGYEENVDPYLLSHPANCQILQHKDNISKHCTCLFTLEELIRRVEEWNKKYGTYSNKINYDILKENNINVIRYNGVVV